MYVEAETLKNVITYVDLYLCKLGNGERLVCLGENANTKWSSRGTSRLEMSFVNLSLHRLACALPLPLSKIWSLLPAQTRTHAIIKEIIFQIKEEKWGLDSTEHFCWWKDFFQWGMASFSFLLLQPKLQRGEAGKVVAADGESVDYKKDAL